MRTNNCQSKLQEILNRHNRDHLLRHKIISNGTRAERARNIKLAFRQLREDGFKIEDPRNFSTKHIEHLVARWDRENLSAGTIQLRLSAMRGFATWIGKPGLVRAPESYLPKERVRRSYSATKDKSWSTNGVAAAAKIKEIEARDPHVAMQLKLCAAFGLRRKEAVMMKPNRADHGNYLAVSEGTKGGRDRIVPIVTDEQRAVLNEARAMAKTIDGTVSKPRLTLRQSLDRISNTVRVFGISKKDLGVTIHGLRSEYANDRYESISGVPAPLRGGHVDDRETDRAARLQVSEELGHAREDITNAYLGGVK